MTRKVVRRFDLGQLKNVEETQQGYLKAPAFATRTGVFNYRKPDGSVYRELRHPDEIFKKESLATLQSAPLTNEHPPDGLLNPSNTKNYMVGVTGENVEREDNFVKTSVTIMDKDAIAAVKNGKVELSCGYEAELDETPGNFDGEDYDCIQRNVVYNHLALVSKGRAGPSVKLRVDSSDAEQYDEGESNSQTTGSTEIPARESNPNNSFNASGNSAVSDKPNDKGQTMEKLKVGDKEFDVAPEVAKHVAEMQGNLEKMKGEYDKMKSDYDAKMKGAENANQENGNQGKPGSESNELDAAKKDLDAAKAKCDALESEVTKLKSTRVDGDFLKAYKARKTLETLAVRTLTKEVVEKLDSMSEREIKIAIISAEQPKADLKDKSDVYVDARFDAVAEMVGHNTQADFGKTVVEARADGNVDELEAARKRQMADAQAAYKGTKKQA